ncbi:helix-turn-helix transcriptional regulator [Huintestinicola sp.]|jgi:bacteriophage CI repressor helix-turn-helix domain|uniref:helix-turn-helix domain-containing protein n=1 Tax=Huintestinicola sp. TaxID=2981661 RepID=UPI0011C9D9D9
MTIFWRKYNELCDEHGLKPRALATELGISAATVTKWVNDGMPNLDMITRIAEYFDVPIDYLINEDDTPIIPQANKKRSVFKSVSSLSQRWVSLRRGSEISLEMQLKIIPYVNCTVQFLNNDKYIEYVPETSYDTEHLKDTETIFDILGILDHCADTESYRIVQVQLSRIVLYHLKEKGFDREALRTEHLDQEKMEYLYTGKDSGKTHNYGLNFSDMDFLREFTGLSYQVMFTGIE